MLIVGMLSACATPAKNLPPPKILSEDCSGTLM